MSCTERAIDLSPLVLVVLILAILGWNITAAIINYKLKVQGFEEMEEDDD